MIVSDSVTVAVHMCVSVVVDVQALARVVKIIGREASAASVAEISIDLGGERYLCRFCRLSAFREV